MGAIQLEFDCLDMTESELKHFMLEKELAAVKKELGNVRRGLFARHNALAKSLVDCQDQIIELRIKISQLENKS